jgi:D-alanyl-lipoteichoic acid acyltransferase DltB (MBOAT superfamily)
MQYNSWLYLLVFLGATVLCYYLTPLKHRWTVLLAASAVFYWISCRWLILVLPLTTIPLYFGTLRMDQNRQEFKSKKADLDHAARKALKAQTERRTGRLLAGLCCLTFGILFFTKYFNFASGNLNLLLRSFSRAQIPQLHLLMPLGISFYTLSAVSYAADVAHGVCRAQTNYAKLLLFLLFFPVITEGPICRYSQLGQQVSEGHTFNYRSFCFGLQLIVWGLFQKVVLADRLDQFVGNIFSNYRLYSGGVILFASVAYTFQIYMDFAGCVDIARGSAELFGITLPENFRRPFFATSVNDFWRRWHITLGAWLRDYIFYPLSMSRPFQTLSAHSRKHMNAYYASTVPALIALLAVWFGNGIWHGAAWKYVCYGLYYYVITAVGMLLEPVFVRMRNTLHLDGQNKGFHLFQILRTFVLVNLGMLIFRADSLSAAWAMFQSVFHPYAGNLGQVLQKQGLPMGQALIAAGGAILVFVVSLYRERGISLRDSIAAKPVSVRWSIYIGVILLVLIAGAYGPGFGAVDFIYAQF